MLELPTSIAANISHFTGRIWLLPKLIEWYEQSANRFLLLTGDPGTGKSALIAWLAGEGPSPTSSIARSQLEQLRSQVAATHFCIATSRNYTPRAFAKNMAIQLTRNVQGFGNVLAASPADGVQISSIQQVEKVEAGGSVTGISIGQLDLGTLSDELSFDRVFSEPLKKLYAGGYAKPMLLLIDALDEAQTYTGVTLVQLLARLTDLPQQVRILATTRPDPRVLTFFRRDRSLNLIADAPVDADDVRCFMEQQLAGADSLNDTRRLVQLVSRISEAARGNFLYAYFVLNDLLPRLPDLSDPEVVQLPKDLGDLYHDFLLREVAPDAPRWDELYKPLLGLLAVAQEPGFTRTQLERITGHELERALRACKQFLSGDLPEGPFRPFHRSFAQFLLEDEGNVDYHIDAARMHRRIADYYRSEYPGDWSKSDDYGLRNLPLHLGAARQYQILRALLTDFNWLQGKLNATEIDAIVYDYDILGVEDEKISAFENIQSALRRSAQILSRDKTQLAAQLLGRLLEFKNDEIQRLLEGAKVYERTPWLRPLTASLAAERSVRWLRPAQEETMDSVVFSSNGLWAAHVSGSFGAEPRSVLLWDLTEWKQLGPRFRTVARLNPFALALSDDARWCVYADSIGGVHRLDALSDDVWTGRKHRTIAQRLAVSLDGQRLLSACQHGRLVAWDIKAGLSEIIYKESKNGVEALCLDSLGKSAVVARRDGLTDLLDLWPTRRRTLFKINGQPTALSRTADNKLLAVASINGQIEVRLVSSPEQPILALSIQEKPTSIALSNDYKNLAVGTEKGEIEVWNIESRRRSAQYSGAHAYEIKHVVFPHNSDRLVSADGVQIKEWALKAVDEEEPRSVLGRVTGQVKVTADGFRAVAVIDDGRLGVWNMHTGALETALPRPAGLGFGDRNIGPPEGLALATKSSRVLSWNNKLICVWDLEASSIVRSLSVADTRDAAIAPDGKDVVYLDGYSVSKWTPSEGEKFQVLGTYDGDPPGFVTISPDGQRALSSGGDRRVVEWSLDVNRSQVLSDAVMRRGGWQNSWWPDSRDKPSRILFAGPNDAIVTTGDGSMFAIRIGEGELKRFHGRHEAFINGLLVTNEGKIVVTSSRDEKIMIWDLGERRRIAVFDAHPGYLCQVSHSEQQALILTRAGVLKIISLHDGTLLAAFQADKIITTCAADVQFRWVVACDQGGAMHFLHFEDKT